LANADVVISSTAAPHTIFDREMVSTAVANRPQRPLVMMDIAVPRDVAEDVESLEQVHVYDIDQLGDHLTHSVKQRRAEIPEVEAILAEELHRFDEWYQGLAIRPVIKAMRIKAESLRTEQLKKTLRQLPDLDRESQLAIDTLTCALVKKILHEPTMCLKEQSRDGQAAQYALFARELFGLDPRRQPGQENEK
jgi:glutamyl-tRNA reductase